MCNSKNWLYLSSCGMCYDPFQQPSYIRPLMFITDSVLALCIECCRFRYRWPFAGSEILDAKLLMISRPIARFRTDVIPCIPSSMLNCITYLAAIDIALPYSVCTSIVYRFSPYAHNVYGQLCSACYHGMLSFISSVVAFCQTSRLINTHCDRQCEWGLCSPAIVNSRYPHVILPMVTHRKLTDYLQHDTFTMLYWSCPRDILNPSPRFGFCRRRTTLMITSGL